MRRALIWLLVLGLLAAAFFYGRSYVRSHPQDVPWTELHLDHPIGLFTLRKLAALSEDPAQCRALVAQAGAGDVPAPPRRATPDCGYDDGLRLGRAAGEAAMSPTNVVTSCPVAAALVILERQVIQPAADRHFGTAVHEVTNAGSYSCRRLYGRTEGEFSEHATGDAIDITGFVLADGTVVSVLRDWRSGGAKGAFLKDVRDGACRLFSTTLSPDYNAAHADHLHLDMAARGKAGVSVCR
ncbi:MAG TPA: extensin family protein [Sphingomicrobium sp.]|nr:extensin family protein [Sphingomicrobium sp.]